MSVHTQDLTVLNTSHCNITWFAIATKLATDVAAPAWWGAPNFNSETINHISNIEDIRDAKIKFDASFTLDLKCIFRNEEKSGAEVCPGILL